MPICCQALKTPMLSPLLSTPNLAARGLGLLIVDQEVRDSNSRVGTTPSRRFNELPQEPSLGELLISTIRSSSARPWRGQNEARLIQQGARP